jgi:hypothetical protein
MLISSLYNENIGIAEISNERDKHADKFLEVSSIDNQKNQKEYLKIHPLTCDNFNLSTYFLQSLKNKATHDMERNNHIKNAFSFLDLFFSTNSDSSHLNQNFLSLQYYNLRNDFELLDSSGSSSSLAVSVSPIFSSFHNDVILTLLKSIFGIFSVIPESIKIGIKEFLGTKNLKKKRCKKKGSSLLDTNIDNTPEGKIKKYPLSKLRVFFNLSGLYFLLYNNENASVNSSGKMKLSLLSLFTFYRVSILYNNFHDYINHDIYNSGNKNSLDLCFGEALVLSYPVSSSLSSCGSPVKCFKTFSADISENKLFPFLMNNSHFFLHFSSPFEPTTHSSKLTISSSSFLFNITPSLIYSYFLFISNNSFYKNKQSIFSYLKFFSSFFENKIKSDYVSYISKSCLKSDGFNDIKNSTEISLPINLSLSFGYLIMNFYPEYSKAENSKYFNFSFDSITIKSPCIAENEIENTEKNINMFYYTKVLGIQFCMMNDNLFRDSVDIISNNTLNRKFDINIDFISNNKYEEPNKNMLGEDVLKVFHPFIGKISIVPANITIFEENLIDFFFVASSYVDEFERNLKENEKSVNEKEESNNENLNELNLEKFNLDTQSLNEMLHSSYDGFSSNLIKSDDSFLLGECVKSDECILNMIWGNVLVILDSFILNITKNNGCSIFMFLFENAYANLLLYNFSPLYSILEHNPPLFSLKAGIKKLSLFFYDSPTLKNQILINNFIPFFVLEFEDIFFFFIKTINCEYFSFKLGNLFFKRKLQKNDNEEIEEVLLLEFEKTVDYKNDLEFLECSDYSYINNLVKIVNTSHSNNISSFLILDGRETNCYVDSISNIVCGCSFYKPESVCSTSSSLTPTIYLSLCFCSLHLNISKSYIRTFLSLLNEYFSDVDNSIKFNIFSLLKIPVYNFYQKIWSVYGEMSRTSSPEVLESTENMSLGNSMNVNIKCSSIKIDFEEWDKTVYVAIIERICAKFKNSFSFSGKDWDLEFSLGLLSFRRNLIQSNKFLCHSLLLLSPSQCNIINKTNNNNNSNTDNKYSFYMRMVKKSISEESQKISLFMNTSSLRIVFLLNVINDIYSYFCGFEDLNTRILELVNAVRGVRNPVNNNKFSIIPFEFSFNIKSPVLFIPFESNNLCLPFEVYNSSEVEMLVIHLGDIFTPSLSYSDHSKSISFFQNLHISLLNAKENVEFDLYDALNFFPNQIRKSDSLNVEEIFSSKYFELNSFFEILKSEGYCQFSINTSSSPNFNLSIFSQFTSLDFLINNRIFNILNLFLVDVNEKYISFFKNTSRFILEFSHITPSKDENSSKYQVSIKGNIKNSSIKILDKNFDVICSNINDIEFDFINSTETTFDLKISDFLLENIVGKFSLLKNDFDDQKFFFQFILKKSSNFSKVFTKVKFSQILIDFNFFFKILEFLNQPLEFVSNLKKLKKSFNSSTSPYLLLQKNSCIGIFEFSFPNVFIKLMEDHFPYYYVLKFDIFFSLCENCFETTLFQLKNYQESIKSDSSSINWFEIADHLNSVSNPFFDNLHGIGLCSIKEVPEKDKIQKNKTEIKFTENYRESNELQEENKRIISENIQNAISSTCESSTSSENTRTYEKAPSHISSYSFFKFLSIYNLQECSVVVDNIGFWRCDGKIATKENNLKKREIFSDLRISTTFCVLFSRFSKDLEEAGQTIFSDFFLKFSFGSGSNDKERKINLSFQDLFLFFSYYKCIYELVHNLKNDKRVDDVDLYFPSVFLRFSQLFINGVLEVDPLNIFLYPSEERNHCIKFFLVSTSKTRFAVVLSGKCTSFNSFEKSQSSLIPFAKVPLQHSSSELLFEFPSCVVLCMISYFQISVEYFNEKFQIFEPLIENADISIKLKEDKKEVNFESNFILKQLIFPLFSNLNPPLHAFFQPSSSVISSLKSHVVNVNVRDPFIINIIPSTIKSLTKALKYVLKSWKCNLDSLSLLPQSLSSSPIFNSPNVVLGISFLTSSLADFGNSEIFSVPEKIEVSVEKYQVRNLTGVNINIDTEDCCHYEINSECEKEFNNSVLTLKICGLIESIQINLKNKENIKVRFTKESDSEIIWIGFYYLYHMSVPVLLICSDVIIANTSLTPLYFKEMDNSPIVNPNHFFFVPINYMGRVIRFCSSENTELQDPIIESIDLSSFTTNQIQIMNRIKLSSSLMYISEDSFVEYCSDHYSQNSDFGCVSDLLKENHDSFENTENIRCFIFGFPIRFSNSLPFPIFIEVINCDLEKYFNDEKFNKCNNCENGNFKAGEIYCLEYVKNIKTYLMCILPGDSVQFNKVENYNNIFCRIGFGKAGKEFICFTGNWSTIIDIILFSSNESQLPFKVLKINDIYVSCKVVYENTFSSKNISFFSPYWILNFTNLDLLIKERPCKKLEITPTNSCDFSDISNNNNNSNNPKGLFSFIKKFAPKKLSSNKEISENSENNLIELCTKLVYNLPFDFGGEKNKNVNKHVLPFPFSFYQLELIDSLEKSKEMIKFYIECDQNVQYNYKTKSVYFLDDVISNLQIPDKIKNFHNDSNNPNLDFVHEISVNTQKGKYPFSDTSMVSVCFRYSFVNLNEEIDYDILVRRFDETLEFQTEISCCKGLYDSYSLQPSYFLFSFSTTAKYIFLPCLITGKSKQICLLLPSKCKEVEWISTNIDSFGSKNHFIQIALVPKDKSRQESKVNLCWSGKIDISSLNDECIFVKKPEFSEEDSSNFEPSGFAAVYINAKEVSGVKSNLISIKSQSLSSELTTPYCIYNNLPLKIRLSQLVGNKFIYKICINKNQKCNFAPFEGNSSNVFVEFFDDNILLERIEWKESYNMWKRGYQLLESSKNRFVLSLTLNNFEYEQYQYRNNDNKKIYQCSVKPSSEGFIKIIEFSENFIRGSKKIVKNPEIFFFVNIIFEKIDFSLISERGIPQSPKKQQENRYFELGLISFSNVTLQVKYLIQASLISSLYFGLDDLAIYNYVPDSFPYSIFSKKINPNNININNSNSNDNGNDNNNNNDDIHVSDLVVSRTGSESEKSFFLKMEFDHEFSKSFFLYLKFLSIHLSDFCVNFDIHTFYHLWNYYESELNLNVLINLLSKKQEEFIRKKDFNDLEKVDYYFIERRIPQLVRFYENVDSLSNVSSFSSKWLQISPNSSSSPNSDTSASKSSLFSSLIGGRIMIKDLGTNNFYLHIGYRGKMDLNDYKKIYSVVDLVSLFPPLQQSIPILQLYKHNFEGNLFSILKLLISSYKIPLLKNLLKGVDLYSGIFDLSDTLGSGIKDLALEVWGGKTENIVQSIFTTSKNTTHVIGGLLCKTSSSIRSYILPFLTPNESLKSISPPPSFPSSSSSSSSSSPSPSPSSSSPSPSSSFVSLSSSSSSLSALPAKSLFGKIVGYFKGDEKGKMSIPIEMSLFALDGGLFLLERVGEGFKYISGVRKDIMLPERRFGRYFEGEGGVKRYNKRVSIIYGLLSHCKEDTLSSVEKVLNVVLYESRAMLLTTCRILCFVIEKDEERGERIICSFETKVNKINTSIFEKKMVFSKFNFGNNKVEKFSFDFNNLNDLNEFAQFLVRNN